MKKYLLLLLPFIVILNSCQKIAGTAIMGNNTATGTTSYQPLSAGSTWTYRTDYGSTLGADTSKITMGSKTTTINSKLYTQAYETLTSYPGLIDTGYYYASNHDYSTMQIVATSSTSSSTVEFLYLKDNSAVGTTWTGTINYPSIATFTLNGKITEKGVTKTFLGKTYTNIIHSTVVLTITILGVSQPNTYDFYVAQGIGIVHIDLNSPGYPTTTQDLLSYNIK
jgi:hypothetical protein